MTLRSRLLRAACLGLLGLQAWGFAQAQTTLPAQALDEAAQFAQATNSQTLIIVHKGVVQLERHFGEAQASASFSGPGLAETLAALSLGGAVSAGRIGERVGERMGAADPAPQLYVLNGAGGLQLALVPSEQLLILRVGQASPAWRVQALPHLLYAALHPELKADWDWLYDWRLANRPAPGSASLIDFNKPEQWPVERVVGGQAAALPRRHSACLTPEALAPALAEIQRVKSYSFMVWRAGAVEYEYYAPGFSADSRAEPASMHKSVLAILLGQAVADGFIPSLQTPISRWLTEWAGDARGAITVEQMLQMASGLAPLPFDMKPGSAYSRALYGADSAAVPLSATLADAPGSRFNYASGISQLLGLIIERATGQRYADYLSKRLWQPLGAQDAFVTLDHPGGHPRTSSALFARPEDWLRLGLLFAQRGRVGPQQVVDAAWLAAMSAPSPANPNYGYQLWRASPHAPQRRYNSATPAAVPAKEPFLAGDMVYFDGAGAQRVYVSPAEQLVIVRLGAASFDWDDARLPNLVTAAARQCGPVPAPAGRGG